MLTLFLSIFIVLIPSLYFLAQWKNCIGKCLTVNYSKCLFHCRLVAHSLAQCPLQLFCIICRDFCQRFEWYFVWFLLLFYHQMQQVHVVILSYITRLLQCILTHHIYQVFRSLSDFGRSNFIQLKWILYESYAQTRNLRTFPVIRVYCFSGGFLPSHYYITAACCCFSYLFFIDVIDTYSHWLR